METRQAYNHWAATYDTMPNKTRDLELLAGRKVLAGADYASVLELGCGTGKNTGWLAEKAGSLLAVDFSEEMLAIAREKIRLQQVQFRQADLTRPWNFPKATLITFSLVLEHIQNLDFIMEQAAATLLPGGQLYICELHPFKQLAGSRAKFGAGAETVHLEYFVHHISDFFSAAKKCGLHCADLQEWFDEGDRGKAPRLVSFLFRK